MERHHQGNEQASPRLGEKFAIIHMAKGSYPEYKKTPTNQSHNEIAISHPLEWLQLKRPTTLNVREDEQQLETAYFAGRNEYKMVSSLWKSVVFLIKVHMYLSCYPTIPFLSVSISLLQVSISTKRLVRECAQQPVYNSPKRKQLSFTY